MCRGLSINDSVVDFLLEFQTLICVLVGPLDRPVSPDEESHVDSHRSLGYVYDHRTIKRGFGTTLSRSTTFLVLFLLDGIIIGDFL